MVKFVEIESIKEIEYAGLVYDIELEKNHYFAANEIISHNCRLKNEIKDINTFAYTLGGTGVATGSKKVFTLNVNNLIQKGKSLVEETKKLHKYLVAYNEILYEEFNSGMLPVYSAEFITLDKQYLTVGVNGVLEAAEFLGYEISNNQEYKNWLKSILKEIKDCNAEESKLYSERFNKKVSFNTEFVPGEGIGPRLAKADKQAGLKVNRDCYNSYFYKVEDDMNLFDKFDLYSREILDSLDGGSAFHLNIEELPSQETWSKILDYSTKVGCNYWTYNCKVTCCENPSCGYINKNTESTCIKCGTKNISWATRIIGYLKKIKSFSEPRQIEAGLRKYHKEVK